MSTNLQWKEIADKPKVSNSNIKHTPDDIYIVSNFREFVALFGQHEMRIVWVPNPDAPTVVVTKLKGRGIK